MSARFAGESDASEAAASNCSTSSIVACVPSIRDDSTASCIVSGASKTDAFGIAISDAS